MTRLKFSALLGRLGQVNPGLGQQLPWSDFFDAVGSRRFIVRCAIERKLSMMRQLVADDLPSVTRVGRTLNTYPGVAFVETEVSGRTIATWLKDRKGRAGGIRFEIPEPRGMGNCERHPSHSAYPGLGARWPITRFLLTPIEGQYNWPNLGLIINSGLPTFTSISEALVHYLYPGEKVPINAIPDSQVIVRIADTRCWIDHMHFAPTHVNLTLRGNELKGSTAELIGPRRVSRSVGSSGRVKILLPGGADQPQELIVTRGSGWLDHRYLGQLARSNERSDVSYEPPDWATQLSLLVTQGESQFVEYKQQLPSTHEERAKLARTVIAFANTVGGYAIYGVSDLGSGETRVVGVDVQSNTVDALTNIVHDTVVPFPVGLQVVEAEVDAKRLVAVVVPKQHKPFFAMKGDPPRFFVRRQGSTYSATLADVRELAEALAEQPSSMPPWRPWT
ncbi:MAG TPA: ATP-binding protein [Candidatus Dormibacteraeota bacterium]|jgi:hypothetical protein|nr:ATP-binding protein [Candidatus Dormibacteraeota bacterium]